MSVLPAPTTAAAESYDELAPFYDAFTSHHDYEAWTLHLEAAALDAGLAGRRMLDIACGTGKSFLPFLERGYEVTGCDVSAEMLAEAARKAPEVRLERCDMRDLPVLGRFDLVTCLDDSLNYLLSAEEVEAALRGLAANLAPGGVCVFDLNTLSAYRTTFAGDAAVEDGGAYLFWHGETSDDVAAGSTAQATIEIFEPTPDRLYRRRRSRHVQRHYPPEAVLDLLEAAGLRCLAVYRQLIDGSLERSGAEESTHKSVYVVGLRDAEGGGETR